MKKFICILLLVWLYCITMTQRAQNNALANLNNIVSEQENDIRDLQQKVEPKTHINDYGPYNNMEPGPIRSY